jgi:hypothetical protein
VSVESSSAERALGTDEVRGIRKVAQLAYAARVSCKPSSAWTRVLCMMRRHPCHSWALGHTTACGPRVPRSSVSLASLPLIAPQGAGVSMRSFVVAIVVLGLFSYWRWRTKWRHASAETLPATSGGGGTRVLVDDAGIAIDAGGPPLRLAWDNVRVHIESVEGAQRCVIGCSRRPRAARRCAWRRPRPGPTHDRGCSSSRAFVTSR